MNVFSPARCSWRITASSVDAQARYRSQNRLYCSPWGWAALYSSHSSASVTSLRRNSRWTCVHSGSGRGLQLGAGAGNSRRSSSASSSDSGNGQPSANSSARLTYLLTVTGEIFRLRAMARALNPAT